MDKQGEGGEREIYMKEGRDEGEGDRDGGEEGGRREEG